MKLLPPSLVHIIYFIVEVPARIELASLGYKARIINLYTKRPIFYIAKLII